jgi:TonB-dependent starch-binding outer membrane protein SusC
MTAQDGSYRITLAPAGAHQVRAIRLGYAAQTRPVTVPANGNAEANFSLSETAMSLDQVVVTATGETQRRRENGASVGTIDSSMWNSASAPTLSNILSSRTPGLSIQQSSGTTGTGSRTRIRGNNSINLSNDPLIIVDGIRVNNASGGSTGATAVFSIGVGGQSINRLDDFNTDDVETIDVIKGPAAAALYGTAAANGVIQITTKKGRAGKTRWNANTEYGTLTETSTFPSNFAQVGTTSTGLATTTCTLERQTLRTCTPKVDSLLSWNPLENASPFNDGWRQSHGLSANGGSDQTTYFLSGEFEREQGVFAVSQLRRITGRSNVRMQLRPDLDGTLSLGVIRYKIKLPFNDNSSFGAIGSGMLGKAFDCSPTTYKTNLYCGTDSLGRGYLNGNAPPSQLYNIDNNQQNDRLTSSFQANWTPQSWLRGTGTLGADILNRLDEQLVPANKVFLSQSLQEGSRFQDRRRIPTYNAGVSFTANYDIPDAVGLSDIGATSTLGTQYIREEIHATQASGAVLTPGTNSLNGTSARFAVGEFNQEVVTVGFIGQQQFTFKDRLFLTGALRTDRNSAFGTNFTWVAYPSASLSWVVSEEGFFPRTDFVDQLRLRTAIGTSGQRPVFRDAATFFNPQSFRQGTVEVPAISVGGTGNPDLKPEKTSEIEGGFEGSFMKNRFSLELTGYRKRTNDAIIAQTLAPSLGVSNTRLTNIGQVENKGIEALVTLNALRMENVEWSVTSTFSSNRNKLLTGGKDFVPVLLGFNNTQQHRIGYPLGGYFKRQLLSYNDYDGNGYLTRINCPTYEGTANPQLVGGPRCEVVLSDSVEYLGSPIPTREATFNSGLTLFKNARITALFDYRGGYKIFNSSGEFRCASFSNCQTLYDKTVPIKEQARTMQRLMGSEGGFIEDASFVKFRELALTLSAPQAWAQRAKVAGVSLTLAGRNLATWTDYTGLDPEVNANNGNLFSISDFLTQPPVRYFITRLSLNF